MSCFAICESFPNVNPVLVNLSSRTEDLNRPDFAWLFFNQFCAQKKKKKNERQHGKGRVLESKMKYWIENNFGKNTSIILDETIKQNVWEKKNDGDVNVSSTFLVEIGKIRNKHNS